jgi:hypothetical protein
MLIEGLEGTLAGRLYLVEYDEEQWFAGSDETRAYCVETWIKKAKPLGARFFVLRLVPDELFPLRGNEAPYIHLREPIEQEPECGYTVYGHVKFFVKGGLNPVVRAAISRELEKYPKGTDFAICDKADGVALENGRVK